MSWLGLTIEQLYETFKEYNTKYFDGKLPPATIEYSDKMTSAAGICYTRRKVIRLSTHYAEKYGADEVKRVLLYEMIHLIVPGHGKKFYAKMEEIQAKGGEVSRYSKGRATANWEYVCKECGKKHQTGRRLKHGGKYHHCKCSGKLREWRLK